MRVICPNSAVFPAARSSRVEEFAISRPPLSGTPCVTQRHHTRAISRNICASSSLLERVEVEFSSQPASIHRDEVNIHGFDPCCFFMASLVGAQLCALGIDKPDEVVRMLAMIRRGDLISSAGGFFGKPVIPVISCRRLPPGRSSLPCRGWPAARWRPEGANGQMGGAEPWFRLHHLVCHGRKSLDVETSWLEWTRRPARRSEDGPHAQPCPAVEVASVSPSRPAARH